MTALAVFRKFVLILCLILLIINFVPFSYAAITQVNSPLYEPVPEHILSNNVVSYKEYYVVQRSEGTYLYEVNFDLPNSDNPKIRLNHDQFVCICTIYEPTNIQVYKYDVLTGNLDESYQMQAATTSYLLLSGYNYCVQFRSGYFPKQFREDPDLYGAYPIVDIDETTGTSLTNTSPFVTWAQAPVNQVYIRSVLPKPESDDYNRFVVLTSESESHLLWLNYHFEYLYGVTTGAQQTVEYNIQQSDYYAPTFINSDDGFYFKLMMDPILYLYLQNLNFSGTVACNYTLSDYNLITGEFISMTSGNIDDLSPDISYYLFNGYIEFDAVGIDLFGLNYEDHSTDQHLHRAAVIYSTDPDFERWKQSVLTWLENIYNVISATEAAEDVTIEQDTAAASELHQVIDNLQPTDENGSKVNTADVVSEQFSDAQQYISELSVGAVEFNAVVDDFLFSNPFFYIPLIVALAAGLLITILGKNKSND